MLTGKPKVFRIKEKFKSRGIRMKIKAADIARNLNLSKATVSLVLKESVRKPDEGFLIILKKFQEKQNDKKKKKISRN